MGGRRGGKEGRRTDSDCGLRKGGERGGERGGMGEERGRREGRDWLCQFSDGHWGLKIHKEENVVEVIENRKKKKENRDFKLKKKLAKSIMEGDK